MLPVYFYYYRRYLDTINPTPKTITDRLPMNFVELRFVAWAKWLKLRGLWREPPIDTCESLRDFVSARASLVAQKVAVDYCRGKTGLFSHALFEEKEFLDALTVCRWESFAATLGDILILTEGFLRTAGPGIGRGQRDRVDAALARLYPAILASYPVPDHRAAKGWSDVEAAFAIRFAAARAAPARESVDIADHSARRLFETLPIHANMRQLDEGIVFGAVRFRLTAVRQELSQRAHPEKLVAALATSETTP